MTEEFSAGIVAPRVCDKFFDEAFRIEWKRPLGIPADHRPSSYRSASLHKRCNADVFDANGHGRGEDGDAISGGRKVDERVGRAALQKHTRPHLHGLTCGIEPDARSEFRPQQQKRLVRKGTNFGQALSPEAMGFREDGNGVDRIQQTARKSFEAGRHDRKVNLAPLKTAGLASRPAFHEQHFDIRMLTAITRKKLGEQRCHDVWGCSHSQRTGLSTLERMCPFNEQVRIRQQTPALVEKIFTVRRQLQRASDAVEQANS
jgi:hypothetical protein